MSRNPLKGMAELSKKLRELPAEIQRKALAGALDAASDPVLAEAKRLAPRQTGKLADSLRKGPSVSRVDGHSLQIVAFEKKGGHGYLAWWHEYGVAPHLIKVRPEERTIGKKRVATRSLNRLFREELDQGSLKIGEYFVGPVIVHPGHAATPFMRPSLDNKQDEAVREFAKYLRQFLATTTALPGVTR